MVRCHEVPFYISTSLCTLAATYQTINVSIYFDESFTSTLDRSQVPTNRDIMLPKITNGFRRLAASE